MRAVCKDVKTGKMVYKKAGLNCAKTAISSANNDFHTAKPDHILLA